MIKDILVLDYDETLVSSLYAKNEKHADQIIDMYGEIYPGVKFQLPNDDWYVSFLRPWTKELIGYFQTILGLDNVVILSWGSMEYVLRSVNLLGINIQPKNTYTREDMGFRVPLFKGHNCVLVDNEVYDFHRVGEINKVKFLYNLPLEKYVEVPCFDVTMFEKKFEISSNELIHKIEETFER